MKDYSDPAFPIVGASADNQFNGMSLRDYFAAQTLAVMCASNMSATGTFADGPGRATVARVCYLMADAMLEERAQ